jgi:hypothetical protein
MKGEEITETYADSCCKIAMALKMLLDMVLSESLLATVTSKSVALRLK